MVNVRNNRSTGASSSSSSSPSSSSSSSKPLVVRQPGKDTAAPASKPGPIIDDTDQETLLTVLEQKAQRTWHYFWSGTKTTGSGLWYLTAGATILILPLWLLLDLETQRVLTQRMSVASAPPAPFLADIPSGASEALTGVGHALDAMFDSSLSL